MLLEVRDLSAGYGALDVLRGIDLEVGAGELVAVLGANGAGKSTLLRAISRYDVDVRAGSITFDGGDALRSTTERLVRRGALQVPEGRQLFSELSVDDNLRLGAYVTDRRALASDLAAIYARFPQLAARRRQTAFALSGGEQQMLVIARALLSRPRLLMLDEPSLGLAPKITDRIYEIIGDICRNGVTVLVVEQNAERALEAADRIYVLNGGRVRLSGAAVELRGNPDFEAAYFGLATEEAG